MCYVYLGYNVGINAGVLVNRVLHRTSNLRLRRRDNLHVGRVDEPIRHGGVSTRPVPNTPPPPPPIHRAPHAFRLNWTMSKGGVIAFSSGGEGETAVHLRNSTFQNNTAKTSGGGVVYLMESVTVVVQGDGNVFEGHTCQVNGAVFAVTDGAELTIEGGTFSSNIAKVRVHASTAFITHAGSKMMLPTLVRSTGLTRVCSGLLQFLE